MGFSPKAQKPTPAPPPIPPVSPESENTKLAKEFELREMRRKKGRMSTLIQPSMKPAKQDQTVINKTTLG